ELNLSAEKGGVALNTTLRRLTRHECDGGTVEILLLPVSASEDVPIKAKPVARGVYAKPFVRLKSRRGVKAPCRHKSPPGAKYHSVPKYRINDRYRVRIIAGVRIIHLVIDQ